MNNIFFANIRSIDVVFPPFTIYNVMHHILLKPAPSARHLCESYLDATDSKPYYDRLEREEARQYLSTLARRQFTGDSIAQSTLSLL